MEPSSREGQLAGDTRAARPAETHALLGRGTRFEGKLLFEGRVRIEGELQGEARGDLLIVGEGGKVLGDVLVGTCIVNGGEVEGNIRAREAIELYAGSKVVGTLHAPNVFIDRGVVFDGTCKMAPLEPEHKTPATASHPPPNDATEARASEPSEAPAEPRPGEAANDT